MSIMSDDEMALNSIPEKHRYRLLVIGSSQVGKTALIRRFLGDTFDDRYHPTIEDFHKKLYVIRGEKYLLEIMDTSGMNPFPAKQRISIMSADIFIVMFALDSMASFLAAQTLRQQILDFKSQAAKNLSLKARETPMVLVGNKLDCTRSVAEKDVIEYLTRPGSGGKHCPFVEASARDDINIDEIFLKGGANREKNGLLSQLFACARVPLAMTPAHHKRLSETSYLTGITDMRGATSSWLERGKSTLSFRRKFSSVGLSVYATEAALGSVSQTPNIDAELRRVEHRMERGASGRRIGRGAVTQQASTTGGHCRRRRALSSASCVVM